MINVSLKPLTASLFIGGFLPFFAHANDISKITAVTIYQGNASVTRELPISGVGEQQVVFGCLSGNLEQNSIQVTASEGVNIGEMNVQTLSGEQAKLCQRQGNQGLSDTQNQLDSVTAKLQAHENTLAYLQNFGKVTQLPTNSDIKTSANQIKQASEDTALAITALRQQKAQLESQLASDMNASSTVANRITQVSVKLASRNLGNNGAKVTLHYLVNGASWQPQYQASLDTKAQKITLDLQAIVAQTTGENWQNIPLTLSTIQPSYQTAMNEPRPSQFSLYDPKNPAYPVVPAPVMVEVGAMGYSTDDSLSKKQSAEAPPLPSYRASINNKSDIVEYQLPQPVTIPSDGRRITTQLDSQSSTADVWVRVQPTQEQYNQPQGGYWYAKADPLAFRGNNGDKQWTDGQMRLYRDGNYVGTGDFDSEKLTKDGLGFGINKQIIVTDLNAGVKNQTENTKDSYGRKTESASYRYRVKNTMNQPITIELVEAQPVATESQISIKPSFNPQPTTQTWHDKNNMLAWLFNLNPQESKDIGASYQISYPKDKQLVEN